MSIRRILRSIITYIVIITGSLTLWPIALICAALGKRELGDLLVPVAWSRAMLAAAGIKRDVAGIENVANLHGPCVIMSNHRSHLDGPILLCTLPLRFAFIIKRSLALIPFWGWAVSALGYISIDRHDRTDSLSGMKRAAKAVQKGRSVLVFPEGTRSKTGDFLPFKKGGVVLAIEAQVPILPVAIAGTYEILPSGRLTAEPGRVFINIGKLISTAGLTYEDRNGLLARVEAEVHALYDEALRRLKQ